jgi:hypothetical protein
VDTFVKEVALNADPQVLEENRWLGVCLIFIRVGLVVART